MWATIPFLVTMLVALVTITYVPALTEASASMSPYDPVRSARLANLVSDIHEAANELTDVKQLTLVYADGTPLTHADGKPVVKLLADCGKIADEVQRGGCTKVFDAVKACKGKPDEATCEHHAIAAWVVSDVNGGEDQAAQFVLVDSVPLVKTDGTPVKDKAGAPVVKKIDKCAGEIDVDTCRQLFLDVSNCKISPPDSGADACIKDKVGSWVDSNAGSE